MVWRGQQSVAMLNRTRFRDVEGAIRSSKTTLCLWDELNQLLEHPGIHTLLSRWTDDATDSILKPVWLDILRKAGEYPHWEATQHCYVFGNGSKAYVKGLKASEETNRYGKFRGLTLARFYVDQAEEVPHDVFQELKGRLSQKGFPHQGTISPNPPSEDHWIADEFPEDNHLVDHAYIRLTLYDNAQNLDPQTIASLEQEYPVGHAKHGPMILGLRGLNVKGEAVYKGLFNRPLHVKPLVMNPQLPLLEVYDFGKHHPCVVWGQFDPWGGLAVLGGIMGRDLFIEDFAPLVARYRAQWFPNALEVQWACDPAGSHQNSQGTRLNGVTVLQSHEVYPRWVDNSNAPDVRRGAIERIGGYLRKRTAKGSEAFAIDDTHWLTVSERESVFKPFLAQGFEAGYVWDERMRSTAGGKSITVPLKDGWYEHGMNCLEYMELNYGRSQQSEKQMESRAARVHAQSLRRAQIDRDPYDIRGQISGRRGGY